MSEQRVVFLRNGFIGTCAFAALVLLAGFYSIVSAAVDRAAKQRVAAVEGTSVAAIAALSRQQPRRAALFARIGN